MRRRRIAVVTGTRAEYGILSPVLAEIRRAGLDLRLIATGMHLMREFGGTAAQISSAPISNPAASGSSGAQASSALAGGMRRPCDCDLAFDLWLISLWPPDRARPGQVQTQ